MDVEDMSSGEVKVLNVIGQNPEFSKDGIASEINYTESYVNQVVNKFREYNLVVEGQIDVYRWLLTGKGAGFLKDALHYKLQDFDLPLQMKDLAKVYYYRPTPERHVVSALIDPIEKTITKEG